MPTRDFSLPLVETCRDQGQEDRRRFSCHLQAYKAENHKMAIADIKVNTDHMGQDLGGLLIDAAENYSKNSGWSCGRTDLFVLKANARARRLRRCYAKAGFKFQSSSAARWGSKEHPRSEWQRW